MISFYLNHKDRPRATVYMTVALFGKQYRKSIGAGLPARYWNERKKRAKVTADFDGNPVNDAIDRWEEIGKRAVKFFVDARRSPTQEEFAEKLREYSAIDTGEPAAPETRYFCDYIERVYIPRYRLVRGIDTLKIYNTVLNKLHEFEKARKRRISFEEINIDFYNSFKRWFFSKQYSANYFGNVIKVVKQMYREARDTDKLHDGTGTDHRDFVATNDTADSVYLDTGELDRIYRFPLTAETVQDPAHPLPEHKLQQKVAALRRARGLFLIGCYTGLRVSDFSRLRDAHVGEFITIKTAKTGASVVIPIHPVVRAILDGGFDLTDTVTDQRLNDQIKELCRLAGITQEVMVNRNVGGENREVVVEKYRLISSHTARRSFATNAYKAGVPSIAIMKITGHRLESTFLKYIRVTEQENAEMLSRHPFFRGNTNE